MRRSTLYTSKHGELVLKSTQPIIVYFPDSSLWLSRAVSKANRKEFVQKVQEMFDQLSGPVVLICGQNKVETGLREKEKFTMILPNLSHLATMVAVHLFVNIDAYNPMPRVMDGVTPPWNYSGGSASTLIGMMCFGKWVYGVLQSTVSSNDVG